MLVYQRLIGTFFGTIGHGGVEYERRIYPQKQSDHPPTNIQLTMTAQLVAALAESTCPLSFRNGMAQKY